MVPVAQPSQSYPSTHSSTMVGMQGTWCKGPGRQLWTPQSKVSDSVPDKRVHTCAYPRQGHLLRPSSAPRKQSNSKVWNGVGVGGPAGHSHSRPPSSSTGLKALHRELASCGAEAGFKPTSAHVQSCAHGTLPLPTSLWPVGPRRAKGHNCGQPVRTHVGPQRQMVPMVGLGSERNLAEGDLVPTQLKTPSLSKPPGQAFVID